MTNELYGKLYDLLVTLTPNVYRNKAISGVFPYCVIKIDTMIDTYPTHDYSVVLAFYDKDVQSIQPLETLADNTVKMLNNQVLSSTNQTYHFKLSLRQFINSENLVGTQAIELQFLTRTYLKGV